jgi:class 3 adenylate cyclase
MTLTDLLDDIADRTTDELRTPVKVDATKQFPTRSQIPTDRRWLQIEDVVAMVADLKGSTRLSFNRHASSSARTYEAVTGSGIEIVEAFDPAFIDVQGDGFFALFHGKHASARAFCAALTLRTFSERIFVPEIRKVMPDGYPTDTGLKTGIARSTLLVKKVGGKTAEPIWAGKAVNYAAKCAQAADAHQIIVTPDVYTLLEGNDYIRYSCRCVSLLAKAFAAAPHPVWDKLHVRSLGEYGRGCRVRTRPWCETCGNEFADAILSGEHRRDDISGLARL